MDQVKHKPDSIYLQKVADLHDAAKDILDDIIIAQRSVEYLEESQENFRDMFGKTDGQIAYEIVQEKRTVTRLKRSYSKLMQQINH